MRPDRWILPVCYGNPRMGDNGRYHGYHPPSYDGLCTCVGFYPISVGNPREFTQAEKHEQEIAEGCKRLIKNAIICWNYLYLTQKIDREDNPEHQQILLQAIARGSVVAWQHINLLGEYDFSEERLRDTVGIKPPEILISNTS